MSGLYNVLLTINHCQNAPIADLTTSDPFVQIYIGNQMIGKTPVIKRKLNAFWDYSLEFSVYTLNTTVDFLIVDDDEGQNNDVLGRLSVQLNAIKDGDHDFSVEKQVLHHSSIQQIFQGIARAVLRKGGDFTLSINVQITKNVVLPEKFSFLPSSRVSGTPAASVAVPTLTFVQDSLWEKLSLAQQQAIADYYRTLLILPQPEKKLKEYELEIIDVIREMKEFLPGGNDFQEGMIIRGKPNLQNSTQLVVSNQKPTFDSHDLMEENSLQINLNKKESSFFRIKFPNRFKMLIWFEWLTAAWMHWTDEQSRSWQCPPFLEENLKVRSHAVPEEKELVVILDINNSFVVKIDARNIVIDNLCSLLLSADSILPDDTVAAVQVLKNDSITYSASHLRNKIKSFETIFNNEHESFFDFNETDSVNLVTIRAYNERVLNGTGNLNLCEIYQKLPSSGIAEKEGVVKLHLAGDYSLSNFSVSFRDARTDPTLFVSCSLIDGAGHVIGSVTDAAKVDLARIANRYVAPTSSETIINASNSLNAQYIKITVSFHSNFGLGNKVLGSFNVPLAEASENPKVITNDFNNGMKMTFTLRRLYQEVEAKVRFRVSHPVNNLWYGELGNMNRNSEGVLVCFDHHHLILYSLDQTNEKRKIVHKVSWSTVSNVTLVTPSILSVHYQYDSQPLLLFVFNCPSESLKKLSEERRQFAPFRKLIVDILSCGNGEKQEKFCFQVFQMVVESLENHIFKETEKKKLLFLQLYLYEVMKIIDWNYYSATKLYEFSISRIDQPTISSTETFTNEDFEERTNLLNNIFEETQPLLCMAVLKGIHEHFQQPDRDFRHFLPAKSILEKCCQKIFDLIGVFYSYPFQFYLETYLSSKLFSTQAAWRSAMILYNQAQEKFHQLQEFFEKLSFNAEISIRFQSPIDLSKHLPYQFLLDNFVKCFIIDMKKMVPNNMISAFKENKTDEVGLKIVKEIAIPLLGALNHTYEAASAQNTFHTDAITNLSGLMCLDTVLSFGRNIADDVLATSEEWLLYHAGGDSDEKWDRCIEYSLQIAVLADSLQHGEKRVLSDSIFPEKEKYQLLLTTVFKEIIDKAVDQLACGLFILLHKQNCLPQEIFKLPEPKSKPSESDPSFFYLIKQRLARVENYVRTQKEECIFFLSALRDTVIAKCLTYYFAAIVSFIKHEPIFPKEQFLKVGKQADLLFREIREYLCDRFRKTENQFDNLLSDYFPSSRFSLLVLSSFNQLIIGDISRLNPTLQELIRESRTDGIESSQMNRALLQFIHLCLYLRKAYLFTNNLSELERLMEDYEKKLSVLAPNLKGENGPSARFSPFVSVFRSLQPISEASSVRLYDARQSPTFSLSFEQILAEHLLFTPLPQEERAQKFHELSSPQASTPFISNPLNWFKSLVSKEGDRKASSPQDHYSIISVMHLLYSESEQRTLSKRIQRLKKMKIHLFDLIQMKVPASILPAEEKPYYLCIPQIQLMDMFYLVEQTRFHLYVVIQIGSWIRRTRKIPGNVFNYNVLHVEQPISIPIYHPLQLWQLSSPTRNNTTIVQNPYLSEEIIVFIMYSTIATESETFNVSDIVIGTFKIPFYHYHHFQSTKTPGNLRLNTEDDHVHKAVLSANKEKRNLPSINYTIQLLSPEDPR